MQESERDNFQCMKLSITFYRENHEKSKYILKTRNEIIIEAYQVNKIENFLNKMTNSPGHNAGRQFSRNGDRFARCARLPQRLQVFISLSASVHSIRRAEFPRVWTYEL